MGDLQTSIDKLRKGIEGIGDRFKGVEERLDTTDGRLEEMLERAKEQEGATEAFAVDLKGLAGKVDGLVGRGRGGMPQAERATAEEAAEFSFVAALKALHEKKFGKNEELHAFEKGLEELTREKVMQGNVGPDGGFLIDQLYVNQLIPELEAQSVMQRAGSQMFNIPGRVGQVVWPRETSGPVGTHVGEGGVITESTPQFDQLIATPKKAVFLVRVTNDLMKMAASAVDPFLRRRLLDKVRLLTDLTGLRGTGSAFQPLGIVNLPNINDVELGTNGAEITLNALQDMQTEIDADNIMPDGHAWVMHARMWGRIRRLRDGFSRPLVNPDVREREAPVLLGAPVFISNQLPTNLTKGSGTNLTEVIYGRFNHAIMASWSGGAEIKVSEEASDGANHAFVQDETWFRLIWTYDWVHEYDEAWSLINDAFSQDP